MLRLYVVQKSTSSVNLLEQRRQNTVPPSLSHLAMLKNVSPKWMKTSALNAMQH